MWFCSLYIHSSGAQNKHARKFSCLLGPSGRPLCWAGAAAAPVCWRFGRSVGRLVRQETDIVWQQAIKQRFALYLYSRHGYWSSSSDGSSSPCHIYISLFFVHLPLFSFSRTDSFFFQRPFLFLFWKWLPSFLYKLTPWGWGEVCLTVGPLSPSHLRLHTELHTVSSHLVSCHSFKKIWYLCLNTL